MADPELSIIFGTYNRLALLKGAVESIRKSVGPHSCEIVIADGSSTDGSREWMAGQGDIVMVEGGLSGAVKAFNAAWAASTGRFVANFNDDAVYIDDCLSQGLRELQGPFAEGVGQIAFEVSIGGVQYMVQQVNGLPYANFGMSPRSVVEKVCEAQGRPENYWNPVYHTYGADNEHSLWIWKLEYTVLGLEGARVEDLGRRDQLRIANEGTNHSRGDSRLFQQRWPYNEPQSKSASEYRKVHRAAQPPTPRETAAARRSRDDACAFWFAGYGGKE